MRRPGFICDGCDDKYKTDPAAVVRGEDGDWEELCVGCYEEHLEEQDITTEHLRTDGGTLEEPDDALDAPGVPRGEGESFGELAERIRGEYEYPVAAYMVSEGRTGPKVQLHQPACRAAGWEAGDQILVFDEGDELRLVKTEREWTRHNGRLRLLGESGDGGGSTP